jgi:hypothetical protein
MLISDGSRYAPARRTQQASATCEGSDAMATAIVSIATAGGVRRLFRLTKLDTAFLWKPHSHAAHG